MNKKYNTLIVCPFIVVFYFFISCSTRKEFPEAYSDLKPFVLNQDNAGYMYMMFFKTEDENIAYIEAFNLQRNLYNSSKYNNIDKGIFYKDIITEKRLLSCADLTLCFTPDREILIYNDEHPIDSLIHKYAHKTDNDKYIVDSELSLEKRLTVIYCLYLNGIYTVWDDYSGFYIFNKNKPQINKAEEIELIPLEEKI